MSIALAVAVVPIVTAFLNRTRLGTALRAVANDREAAALIGVPLRNVEVFAWGCAGGICGIVGVINAALVTFDVTTLAFALLVPSLAAATIGSLRSLWVTMIGGFFIGIVEKLAAPFNGRLEFVSDYSDLAPFVIAVVVVLWLGRKRTIVLSGRAMQ